MVQNYGILDGNDSTHNALLSDVSHNDSHVRDAADKATLEECTDEYDDT
jgi:hypothetical protein